MYPTNIECVWHIKTSIGTRVKLTIHEFDLENSQRILDLTETTYEQSKAYFEFVVERHRQEFDQRLAVLNVLKGQQTAP